MEKNSKYLHYGDVVLKWDHLSLNDQHLSKIWNYTKDTWKDLPPLGVSRKELEIIFDMEEKLNTHPIFYVKGKTNPVTKEYDVFSKVIIEEYHRKNVESLISVIDEEIKAICVYFNQSEYYIFYTYELFREDNRKSYKKLCSIKRLRNHMKHFQVKIVESPVELKSFTVPI